MNFRTLGFLFLVAVILIFSVSFVAAARTSDGEEGGDVQPPRKCMNCVKDPPVEPKEPVPGKIKCIYYMIFGGAQDTIEYHIFRRDNFICIAPEGKP